MQARRRALEAVLYPREYLDTCDRENLAKRMDAQLGRPVRLDTIGAHMSAVLRHRARPRLAQISAPTLVIKPERDILIPPASSERLARRIPNARILRLPDAGHGATFQVADQVNAAIADHIAEFAPAAPAESEPRVAFG